MGSLREKGKIKVVKGYGWEEGTSREKGRVYGRKRGGFTVGKGEGLRL